MPLWFQILRRLSPVQMQGVSWTLLCDGCSFSRERQGTTVSLSAKCKRTQRILPTSGNSCRVPHPMPTDPHTTRRPVDQSMAHVPGSATSRPCDGATTGAYPAEGSRHDLAGRCRRMHSGWPQAVRHGQTPRDVLTPWGMAQFTSRLDRYIALLHQPIEAILNPQGNEKRTHT